MRIEGSCIIVQPEILVGIKFGRILADLNLAVRYGIAIHIYEGPRAIVG